jgi:hypothetical protein
MTANTELLTIIAELPFHKVIFHFGFLLNIGWLVGWFYGV